MKSKWKLRSEYFRGPETYKLSVGSTDLDLIVDEVGCFEIDGIVPTGMYAFAEFINSPHDGHPIS